MKALVIEGYAGEAAAVVADVPAPTPGPDDVVVRVAAAAVNPLDVKLARGYLKDFFPLALPYVLGTDVAGTIERVGAQVSSVREGDRVLAMEQDGALYVVGVLASARAPSIATRAGVTAEVVHEDGRECVRVTDARGQLLFEHDAQANRTVVNVPEGDLELRTEQGAIRLDSAHGVELHAKHLIDLRGEHGVRAAYVREGEPSSSMQMDGRGMRLASPKLEATAVRAGVAVDEGTLVARSVKNTVQTLEQVVGVIHTQAHRIVTRARNLYTEVEELAQSRAGRVRMVAREAMHLFGRRTSLRADEDMKLKADKIYIA